jgi:hypothetical protein
MPFRISGKNLDIGEAQILSSSPECFLNIHDRQVVTRPIKGTRPRGATSGEDARIAAVGAGANSMSIKALAIEIGRCVLL